MANYISENDIEKACVEVLIRDGPYRGKYKRTKEAFEYLRKIINRQREEELEIFDLLFKDDLSEADKKKVKEAAQALLQKLKDNETRRTLLTTDWYKNEQLRGNVNKMIGDVLNQNLPASYDTPTFKQKQGAVYSHVYNVASRGQAYWA